MFFFRNKKDWTLFLIVFLLVGTIFFIFRLGENNDLPADLPVTELSGLKKTVAVSNPSLFGLVQDMISPNINLVRIKEGNPLPNLGFRPVFLAMDGKESAWMKKLADQQESELIDIEKNILDNIPSDYFWIYPQNLEKIIGLIVRLLGQTDPINKEFYINQAYERMVEVREITDWASDNLPATRRFNIIVDERWRRFVGDCEIEIDDSFKKGDSASEKELFELLADKIESKRNPVILVDRDFPLDNFFIFAEGRGIKTEWAVLDAFGEKENSLQEILRKNLSQLTLVFQ